MFHRALYSFYNTIRYFSNEINDYDNLDEF